VWPDGACYEGDYWDGKPHGTGVRQFASGAVYDGEWRVGVMEGKGSYKYHDGSEFQGSFAQDMRHGFGSWSCPRGDRFAGSWVHDVASRGKGLKIHARTGSIYCGDIVDGEMHGYGIESFSESGEVYEGWFVRGKRHGKGCLVNGYDTGGRNSRFEGEFDMARTVSGVGKLMYGHARGQGKGSGGWYAGHILKGMRHGAGVMVYPSGDIYDGEWKSNLRHGYGFMIKGKEMYEGVWVYDDAGEEGDPLWVPYLELDDTILQERVCEQLREVCGQFALAYGTIEILCYTVASQLLKPLLHGSLQPLLAELKAVQELESRLLALDDVDAAHQLVAVRLQGKSVYTRSHALITQRAWDALPQPARKLVEVRQDVAGCLSDMIQRLAHHTLPSVVTWAHFPNVTQHAGKASSDLDLHGFHRSSKESAPRDISRQDRFYRSSKESTCRDASRDVPRQDTVIYNSNVSSGIRKEERGGGKGVTFKNSDSGMVGEEDGFTEGWRERREGGWNESTQLVTFGSFFLWPMRKGKGVGEGGQKMIETLVRPSRIPPSMVGWCAKWYGGGGRIVVQDSVEITHALSSPVTNQSDHSSHALFKRTTSIPPQEFRRTSSIGGTGGGGVGDDSGIKGRGEEEGGAPKGLFRRHLSAAAAMTGKNLDLNVDEGEKENTHVTLKAIELTYYPSVVTWRATGDQTPPTLSTSAHLQTYTQAHNTCNKYAHTINPQQTHNKHTPPSDFLEPHSLAHALQCVSVFVAACCSVLQRVAVRCSALRCVAL